MQVERFESALWQTACLLLIADGQGVAVDPGIGAAEVAVLAGRADELGVRITDVLVTHADWDHVCGLAAFPNATAWMGTLAAERVRSGEAAERIAAAEREYGLAVPGEPRVDRALAPGPAYRIGPFVVETIALPGHTPDGVGYRLRELDLLVVGDHVSAVEFPFVSSSADYRTTLAGLIELLRHDPPGTVVPGHGPALPAPGALEVAEADLAYLRALRDALKGTLASGAGRDEARAAGLAVEVPRAAPEDLAGELAANVETQLAELLPAADQAVRQK